MLCVSMNPFTVLDNSLRNFSLKMDATEGAHTPSASTFHDPADTIQRFVASPTAGYGFPLSISSYTPALVSLFADRHLQFAHITAKHT